MKRLDWYWIVWIAVAFLIPELLAEFKLIPMDTFSGTVQLSEKAHPVLKLVVYGFGIGLVTHLVYSTSFFRSMIVGGLIAVAGHFLQKEL